MNLNMYNITMKLCMLVYPETSVKTYINPYFKLVTHLLKNNGVIFTVRILKQMRLHCTRYISGKPLMTNTVGVGVDREGWPKRLDFLKPLLQTNLKFLLTILLLSRTLKTRGKEKENLIPNYKTITDFPKGNYIIPSGFLNKFVRAYGLKSELEDIEFTERNIYVSSKAGPHGPATITALQGLINFSYPMMQWIFNITSQVGIDYFCSCYKFAWNKDIVPDTKGYKGKNPLALKYLGKLSFIYDPECKLRIIAISDYFSQLFLKPINDHLFKLIKRFPCDRTYTQNPRHIWKQNQEQFWSLDLSSATDRFPIELQRRILERVFNPKLAQSWANLLSKRDYVTPDGKIVRYNTGQPMGSYSSWVAFSLAHHLVVHWCAHLCGFSNFNQYIILGDDIVIKNDAVARKYIEVIGKLGVEISQSKTHVSSDTYEFAKRWFKGEKEISGIPMCGIIDNIGNPYIVYTILYDFFKIKGNSFLCKSSLLFLVKDLYHDLEIRYTQKNKILKRYINLKKRSMLSLECFQINLDMVFGFLTYDALRRIFALYVSNEEYHIPNPKWALQEYHRVLGDGLAYLVQRNLGKLSNFHTDLLEKFPDEDKNEVRNYPIFKGILNHLKRTKEISLEWNLGNITLLEASKGLVQLDINQIFNRDRNKIQSLLNIGKMSKRGFKELNETTEIWYGSSTTESTYTASQSFSSLIKSSPDLAIQELDKVNLGLWVKAQDASSYASAWANW